MAALPDLLAVGRARPTVAARGHLERVAERSAHVAAPDLSLGL